MLSDPRIRKEERGSSHTECKELEMNREQTEDLKAFEQRLIECVSHSKTRTKKWKALFMVMMSWLVFSLCLWWVDDTEYSGYVEMMKGNKNLTLSCMVSFLLYLFGILDKCNASRIITSRCRRVLVDYNMSCDEQGKLILKRKPSKGTWKPG